MEFINFLKSKNGLALLYFTQTFLFAIMVYILGAEYFRTKRKDIIYKLIASSSITLINIATTVIFILDIFFHIPVSQKYFPLIFNALFAIIVLALAKAFMYNYIDNKKKFDILIHSGMLTVVIVYTAMQIYWNMNYKKGMTFGSSFLQLIFAIFFIIILMLTLYYLFRYRKSYRTRLVIGFSAIVIAQSINMYGSIIETIPVHLLLIRAAVPLFVPIMFVSVVFKELIENVVTMADQLKKVIENNGKLVMELIIMGENLKNFSEDLAKTSKEGWLKLSKVVEKIYEQDQDRQDIFVLTNMTFNEVKKMSQNIRENDLEKIWQQSSLTSIDTETVNHHQSSTHNSTNSIALKNKSATGLKKEVVGISHSLLEIEKKLENILLLTLDTSIQALQSSEREHEFAIVVDKISSKIENTRTKAIQINKAIQEITTHDHSADDLTNKNNSHSPLTEDIFTAYEKLKKKHEINRKNVYDKINSVDQLLERNREHGAEMKDAIGEHITEIEGIASLSDDLNTLIKELNERSNLILSQAEEIQSLVKEKY